MPTPDAADSHLYDVAPSEHYDVEQERGDGIVFQCGSCVVRDNVICWHNDWGDEAKE